MTRIPAVRGLLLGAAILLAVGVPSIQAQGLTARLAPAATGVWWGDDVGIRDTPLFGGGLALGFGRFVTLRGSYERANSVRTSLFGSGYGGGAALENSLDASLFATGLELRLGESRIAPILTGVGGVLDVSPDGRESSRQVLVGYGAGLDARLTSWLDAQLLVKDLRFRMDRSSLAGDPGGPIAADPETGDLRRSTAVTAALSARFGGTRESARSDQLDQDMSRAYSGDGLMIPVEMQVGVMRFADALDIEDRGFAGARAGFDFGPYFGLRGSYARGVANGLGSFVGMTSWSGEGQFNLGRVTDLSPHLVLGFGQLNFSDDFRNRSDVTPDDQNAIILGAGVGVPLNARMRVIFTLRDHVTSAGSASGVSSTSDLRHNFGLSGGLSYLVRRGPVGPRPSPTGTLRPVVTRPEPAVPVEPARAVPAAPTPAAEVATVQNPAQPVAATQAPDAKTTAAVLKANVANPGLPTAEIDYQSDRTISIPVPRQGELYIRYGPSPATTAASPTLPVFTSPQVQNGPGATTAPDLDQARVAQLDTLGRVTRADLADLEDRLAGRLGAMSDDEATRGLAERAEATTAQSLAELAALTRQVDELSRLIREQSTQAGSALIVPVGAANPATEIVTEMRAPFFSTFELRVGTSAVRHDGPGMGIAAETSLGGRIVGRLQPFTGLHLSQVSVDGQLGASPFSGSVTSYGAMAGIRMSLPDVRSVAPALSLGVSAVNGGSRGDTPASATVIDDLYGGFVMGPRLALTGEWQRSAASPLQVIGSVAKLWAGSRGGWSFQTGVRWSRPSRLRTVVRPVAQAPITSRAEAPAPFDPPASDTAAVRPDSTRTTPSVDAALLSRLDELEAALQRERAARQRTQAIADSSAAQSRTALARADSLASIASAAERERQAVAAARIDYRRSLEALVGVLPDVQSVRSTPRGLEVLLGGGIFTTGSTDLPPAARAQVERVGTVLSQGPVQRLLINGHTDSTGSTETNLIISGLRAEAVRAVLLDVGFTPDRLSVLASGEDVPLASNDTRDGRARNRRVEIVVVGLD